MKTLRQRPNNRRKSKRRANAPFLVQSCVDRGSLPRLERDRFSPFFY